MKVIVGQQCGLAHICFCVRLPYCKRDSRCDCSKEIARYRMLSSWNFRMTPLQQADPYFFVTRYSR